MSPKKKQTVLTLEELKFKIQKEKAPQWINSSPLFGLFKGRESLQFLPIEKEISDEILILFILDPTDYTSERVFELIDIFKNRYQKLPWVASVVFDQKFLFTRTEQYWDQYKKYPAYNDTPIYRDFLGEFHAWANVEKFPKAILYYKGTPINEYILDATTAAQFLELESNLQELLRKENLGLPLPLLYEYEVESPVDRIKFSNPELNFSGNWTIGKDAIASTDDPGAIITIPFEGKSFRFVSSLHHQAQESSSRVVVTFNDKPIQLDCRSSALKTDSQGVTTVDVDRHQGVYDLIASAKPLKGTLKIHFKNADVNPVVYWCSKIG